MLVPGPSGGAPPTVLALCGALVVVGLGVGLGWPHLLTRVLQVAPKDELDLASASITTAQLFATALGAALAGMVANLAGLTEPGGVGGTSQAALWQFAIFALAPALGLVTAVRSARLRPGAVGQQEASRSETSN